MTQKPKQEAEPEVEATGFELFRDKLRLLYHGSSPAAVRFQFSVLIVDVAILAFFIASPLLWDSPTYLYVDYSIAALMFADLAARMLASTDITRWLRQPANWVDIFILATLLVPVLGNFGFLRVLRLWTISQSQVIWKPLRKHGLMRYEDAGKAVINLVTFLFVVAGFIFTFFYAPGSGIDCYLDALYFTVTTITTTGFGDITLPGPLGRITSIIVMIIGISLFVRLAQQVFRPFKISFPCPQCGLQRHEPDAVHCKACGHILKIPDEGN